MEIIYKENTPVGVFSLNAGDCFKYKRHIYMKTKIEDVAINLTTAAIIGFSKNVCVLPIKAKLIVD